MTPSQIAEAMREAAAKWHEEQAVEQDELRAKHGSEKFPPSWALHHRADAASIRSIPIPDYSEWILVPKKPVETLLLRAMTAAKEASND